MREDQRLDKTQWGERGRSHARRAAAISATEQMCDEAPFSEGDLLCVEGPNVSGGKHVHVAGKPVKRGTQWFNGYRAFCDDGRTVLRMATLEDVDQELRMEVESIVRIAERIERLNEFRKQLTEPL